MQRKGVVCGPPPYGETSTSVGSSISTSTSTSTSPTSSLSSISAPVPVPISALNAARRQERIKQAQHQYTPLQVDAHGTCRVTHTPGWVMTCMMLPCPFAFLGCFLAHSSDLLFDDKKQTLELEHWPAHCNPCGSGHLSIPYSNIANFVAIRDISSKNAQYYAALVTRDGHVYQLNTPQLLMEVYPRVIQLQQFVFGRHPASAWTAPNELDIIYTP